MDPKLAKELEDFKKKKDDVFKNINLLNNLSESLVTSITEEESKIIQKKNKEIIENEKKKTANELELLGLENSKMESYLDILSKKQELEMKYLEQMCDQHAKIHKLGEKYSFLDVESFIPYESHFTNQLVDAKKDYKKNAHLKKGTNENAENAEQKPIPPPPVAPQVNPPPNQAPPVSKLPFPPVENQEATDRGSDFELTEGTSEGNPGQPDGEPPPLRRAPPPPPNRRSTVASPEGIAKRSPQPRRLSLQDQLKAALSDKFIAPIGGPGNKKKRDGDSYDSDESSKDWM
jgi:hypothetical protein